MSTQTNEHDSNGTEDARVGYQVASGLASFYGGAIWSMFNAMLVANSIVVTGITLVLTGQPPLALFKTLLPVVGLLLCMTWFLLVKRAHEYSIYYTLSAREIEERYLAPYIRTLSRGGALGSGKPVPLELGGSQTIYRLGRWARLFRNEVVSYFVILIFVVVYVSAFFLP